MSQLRCTGCYGSGKIIKGGFVGHSIHIECEGTGFIKVSFEDKIKNDLTIKYPELSNECIDELISNAKDISNLKENTDNISNEIKPDAPKMTIRKRGRPKLR